MLWDQFLTHNDKTIYKWEHYFPAYEENFSSYRNKDFVFLEIGVASGGSLQMWRKYFGPLATIVGIDITPECKSHEGPGIHVRIGDQSDSNFLKSIIDEFGVPQIVLDDGGHKMDLINSSFDFLYPSMTANSVYMIEDLHTSYWEEFGGGVLNEMNFINRTKKFIDLLNADHSRGVIEPNSFTRDTYSIHIYDSIVAFRKGSIKNKLPIYTGAGY
jgi:23S rRNA U2552 (ribose-2'-O)-methylase RlmE/FtsJ